MKNATLLLLVLCTVSTNVLAGCDVPTGDQGQTVLLPTVVDGKETCFHEKAPLALSVEEKSERTIDFELSPLQVQFENIPNASAHHYLYVDIGGNEPSTIYLMSFLCSGEIPLGGDAVSESLERFSNHGTQTGNGGIFIATGEAGGNVSVNARKKIRSKVFDKFLEIYEARLGPGETLETDPSSVYVPHVLATSGPSAVGERERRSFSEFFSRTGSSLNACSKKFISALWNLQLEQLVGTRTFPGIELQRKRLSPLYQMRWRL